MAKIKQQEKEIPYIEMTWTDEYKEFEKKCDVGVVDEKLREFFLFSPSLKDSYNYLSDEDKIKYLYLLDKEYKNKFSKSLLDSQGDQSLYYHLLITGMEEGSTFSADKFLSDIEDKYPHELSGGMQKRVSLARAIVTKPQFILYDEPTAGLDPVASTVIEDYILRLREETKATSIVVTHQMSTITRCSDKVIMLYDGNIVFRGTPQELLEQNNPYTKQFVSASLEGPMKITASSF